MFEGLKYDPIIEQPRPEALDLTPFIRLNGAGAYHGDDREDGTKLSYNVVHWEGKCVEGLQCEPQE